MSADKKREVPPPTKAQVGVVRWRAMPAQPEKRLKGFRTLLLRVLVNRAKSESPESIQGELMEDEDGTEGTPTPERKVSDKMTDPEWSFAKLPDGAGKGLGKEARPVAHIAAYEYARESAEVHDWATRMDIEGGSARSDVTQALEDSSQLVFLFSRRLKQRRKTPQALAKYRRETYPFLYELRPELAADKPWQKVGPKRQRRACAALSQQEKFNLHLKQRQKAPLSPPSYKGHELKHARLTCAVEVEGRKLTNQEDWAFGKRQACEVVPVMVDWRRITDEDLAGVLPFYRPFQEEFRGPGRFAKNGKRLTRQGSDRADMYRGWLKDLAALRLRHHHSLETAKEIAEKLGIPREDFARHCRCAIARFQSYFGSFDKGGPISAVPFAEREKRGTK